MAIIEETPELESRMIRLDIQKLNNNKTTNDVKGNKMPSRRIHRNNKFMRRRRCNINTKEKEEEE